MSKINYCSLEEAWGETYKKTLENNTSNNTSNNISNNTSNYIRNNNPNPENVINIYQKNQESKQNQYQENKYDSLDEASKKNRQELIHNMNLVERNNKGETDINKNISEYNKYRTNSFNNVSSNDTKLEYVPFNESIEKKYLEDKLKHLEEQYKYLMQKNGHSNNYIENFDNKFSSTSENSNDLFDIIVLITIGFIIIFILNSVFNLGKRIKSN
jgi:hypothetical protein